MEPLDVSVVIVSWNTRCLLRDCLCSVYADLAATPLLRADVWVVDNASSDDSAAIVRREFPRVRLLQNPENIGFARANNQALRQAEGRHLLLLNSDTLVPPGALAGLVAALDAHPQAAVCGPLLLNGDGSPQINWARFQGPWSELRGALDRTQSPYPLADFADAGKRAQMNPFVVDWVGGACFLVRADAARQAGYLDEAFFMYSEETEWCFRLRETAQKSGNASGGKTLLVPAVTVTHLGGQSSQTVPRQTRERVYRSSLRLFRHLYGAASPAFALSALIATLRWKLWNVKQALRARGSA